MTDSEYKDYIKNNLSQIRENIEKASKKSQYNEKITLLAATKMVETEYINYAITDCGLDYIGENKVQELLDKYDNLEKSKASVQFIGHLQTNKVKYIIDKVDLIHSLDREELANEINKRAGKIGKVMPVLVEINIGREEEKGGIMPEETESFIRNLLKYNNISVKGLMTMAPAHSTEDEYRKYFTQTREIYNQIKALNIPNVSMDILSMGMSDSYEIAIECGSNMVRVGSSIFGRRIYN